MLIFVSSIKFGTFSGIVSSNKLSVLLFPSSSRLIHCIYWFTVYTFYTHIHIYTYYITHCIYCIYRFTILYMVYYRTQEHRFLCSVHFWSILFLSFPQIWYLQVCWLLLPTPSCFCIPLVSSFIQLLYFSAPKFLFDYSLYCLSLLIFMFWPCNIFLNLSIFSFSSLSVF